MLNQLHFLCRSAQNVLHGEYFNKIAAQNWMPFFKEYDRPYFEVQYVYVTHLKTPADLGKFTSTMIHILKFLV